jgi:hypothetical protein
MKCVYAKTTYFHYSLSVVVLVPLETLKSHLLCDNTDRINCQCHNILIVSHPMPLKSKILAKCGGAHL